MEIDGFDWQGVLSLPEATLPSGRTTVYKTDIVRNGALTKREERLLSSVASIEFFAAVSRESAKVPAVVDDDHDIRSIVFLRVIARPGASLVELAPTIHKAFPNPTVILFECGKRIGLSAAVRRLSLAEKGAVAMEEVQVSPLFDSGDSRYSGLLEALSFRSLPQDDQLSFVRGIASGIRLSRAVAKLGYFPSCPPKERESLWDLMGAYEESASKVEALEARRRDKDTSFGESASLRVTIEQEKVIRDEAARRIGELCDE